MKLSIISFTEEGIMLSERIKKAWDETEAVIYTKCTEAAKKNGNTEGARYIGGSIGAWARTQMEQKNALLFIGACGIAVRAIASSVTDKLQDSPVLVMDEKGRYVIPILSGHMGGANELAGRLAEGVGAEAVITTATDLNRAFAVDVFAKRNGLHIVNREGIKKVSAKVLAGKEITISIEPEHLHRNCRIPKGIRIVSCPYEKKADVVIASDGGNLAEKNGGLLWLRPEEYVIGMGCRKGKEAEKIEKFIQRSIEEIGILPEQILALASIDKKKDEPGFLAWSHSFGIPFLTYEADELRQVKGELYRSVFAEEQVGVDNVCERAALKACKGTGRLVYKRHAEDGMTIAIAKREWSVVFDEQ